MVKTAKSFCSLNKMNLICSINEAKATFDTSAQCRESLWLAKIEWS